MQKECRGKVFIINNVKFGETLGSRDGSDKDAKNLTQLFMELHFSVQQQDNLTANEMKNYLCSEAGALKDDTDCVILIILSHGGGTRVYGVDRMPVELKTLTDYFSSDNCSTLYGKPRLVFVQACRSVESASIKKTSHVVKHHGEFEIECFVNTDKKILDVSWIKNAECIKVETSLNKYKKGDTESVKSLKVYNVEDGDKGKYHCIVNYEFEYRTNQSEIKLDIEDVKKASIKKSIYPVEPGTSQIEIECMIKPDKTVKDVIWEKEGDIYPIKNRPSFDKHSIERD
ncbi:caspase-8-like isoform X1 [Mytilus trossulus]|uniref:caspase-8-like isoform X1 n=1 Tax=Mytilus trossulus TaxID=6551 RepID=UPI003005FB2E